MRLAFAVLAALVLSASAQLPSRPWNIAHRGASGKLPEHTAEAYQVSIDDGADFIECDVVVTKDLQLICRHEPLLSDTTDADEKFPDRIATYMIDGVESTGVHSVDLTLEEVKTLTAMQFDGMFAVPSVDEYVDIALNAGRTVGIYPETKHPTWHNEVLNTDMSILLVEALAAKGYGGDVNSESWAQQPVFIQSFEVGNLRMLSEVTDMPLVMLLGGWSGYVTPDNNKTHEEMTTDESLDDIATFAAGIGPWKNALYANGESSGLAARIHERGLQIHPYTFRNEAPQYLGEGTWEADPHAEYHYFFTVEEIEGCFTDFAHTLTDYLNKCYGENAIDCSALPMVGGPDYTPVPEELKMGGSTGEKAGLPADRPWVIGHRGASGALPEHTLQAYQKAVNDGADFIECDVVVTKDMQLICRHEPLLSGTTDAEEKFPDRIATYMIDGDESTGVHSVDLTLEEVKTLRAVQPLSFRSDAYDGEYEVPTVAEYLDLAISQDRVIGVYPETKHPTWHDEVVGGDMTELLIQTMAEAGYDPLGDLTSDTWAEKPAFIQSFEVGNLKAAYEAGYRMPLVQLLGGWSGYVTPDNNKTHEEMTTDEALDEIATYAAGVGPWKNTILPTVDSVSYCYSDDNCGSKGYVAESTGLVERLHERGLHVHPYTMRNEDRYLAWSWGQDAREEMAELLEVELIDGFFTDFPLTAADHITQRQAEGVTYPEKTWHLQVATDGRVGDAGK